MNNKTLKIKKIAVLLFLILIIYLIINPVSLFQNYFILKIPTESMSPAIKPMSIVILKKDTNYSIGDIVAYRNIKNKIIVHRIVDIDNGMIATMGDNNQDIDKKVYKSLILGKVHYIFSIEQVILFSCIFCIFLSMFVYALLILFRGGGNTNEKSA